MKLLVVRYLFIISSCYIFNFSYGRNLNPNFRVKAVNLGGWLVTEGWIKPSLFDAIPNNDFLSLSSIKYDINLQDGTGLQFKSVTEGKYLCAELGGGNIIVANRTAASGWETFKVKTEELVTADHSGGNGGWGDDDPSVFIMKTSGRLEGEFQITNGYGPIMASQVMREHWRTFIVEEDFSFIKSNGLNAVRIPVGWWIASDPTPPKPYVGGSLNALDNAFLWARTYELKVIIDLHAAPGSQNPWEHSANRDGTIEWGKTDDIIQQTVEVIDFLTARYAKNPSLYAKELINEPLAPGYIGHGEWVAEWEVRDATKEDYQKFAQAQLEVFGRATFGWAYWTLKNVNNHWSEIDEGSSNVMIEYGAPWSKNGDFPQHD
ncbi:hypothetical protein K7X08_027610 [Anisodus acutangulus]|uniref:Mannan endo-1,4-beta-mannosidase n=1 Tax=Anisodus acutangulus TaxID=402998 RepID=A0A9Q1RL83_9SOLA|nr:hypothetical protein K7X08_027610 [Anisodus acutangulus]